MNLLVPCVQACTYSSLKPKKNKPQKDNIGAENEEIERGTLASPFAASGTLRAAHLAELLVVLGSILEGGNLLQTSDCSVS